MLLVGWVIVHAAHHVLGWVKKNGKSLVTLLKLQKSHYVCNAATYLHVEI